MRAPVCESHTHRSGAVGGRHDDGGSRVLAVFGGGIPQIKTLDAIPVAFASQQRPRRAVFQKKRLFHRGHRKQRTDPVREGGHHRGSRTQHVKHHANGPGMCTGGEIPELCWM